MQLDDDNNTPFPEPVVIEITDVFDLHSIPPRQVKSVVEEYLRLAHEKHFRAVRIVHGKGTGVQREIVHRILARTSFVLDWRNAPPNAGGMGATVATLAPPEPTETAGTTKDVQVKIESVRRSDK